MALDVSAGIYLVRSQNLKSPIGYLVLESGVMYWDQIDWHRRSFVDFANQSLTDWYNQGREYCEPLNLSSHSSSAHVKSGVWVGDKGRAWCR